ncbi:uncharacterized protein LOC116846730 [Odontomachus brunneus]|uniref:uncharacterized protein LOC116846730 n=1 Tax=Odontomachus brunneus TaxID=486640 RepID=UPI0013F28ADF|nr:uncharacterized protein LOC116846730 [Odontomachus brunneus]
MISQYVGEDHRNWDENLSQIKFAFNTAQNEGTGYTPAFLNNGRELAGPCELERKQSPGTTSTNIHEQLKDAYELVKIHMARAFQKQEKAYNLRRRAWKPHIGDIVWKRAHTLSSKEKAINAKLAPKYIGPLTVKRIISPVIVDLIDENKKWYKHIHIHDLKPNNSE